MTAAAIPARLQRHVSMHLAANLRPTSRARAALLLGIHGPSGEGKTYGVQAVLSEAGAASVPISGGQLESGVAGEPSEIIRDAYCQAGEYIANGQPAAVLLNDADAAIGSWGALTQYTVNTQNVITELMHLADYPNDVAGRRTPRAPIILTGNDFTRLYGPLCRPGRMRLCEWVLTDDERAPILEHMTALPSDHCRELLEEFPGRPIAFWAAAVDAADSVQLSQVIDQVGIGELLRHFVSRRQELRESNPRTLGTLREAARSIATLSDTDHLTTSRAA
jgi:hypothetical protein